jgi:hypothetical protein
LVATSCSARVFVHWQWILCRIFEDLLLSFLLSFGVSGASFPRALSFSPSSATLDDISRNVATDDYDVACHILLLESALSYYSQHAVPVPICEAASQFCSDLSILLPQPDRSRNNGPHKFGPFSTVYGAVYEPTVSSLIALHLMQSLSPCVSALVTMLGSTALETFPDAAQCSTPLLWMCEEPFPFESKVASDRESISTAARISGPLGKRGHGSTSASVGMQTNPEIRPVFGQGRADLVLNLDYSKSPFLDPDDSSKQGVLPSVFFELGKGELVSKFAQAFSVAVGLGQHLKAAGMVYPLLGIVLNSSSFVCRAYVPCHDKCVAVVDIVPETSVSPESIGRLLRLICLWTLGIRDIILNSRSKFCPIIHTRVVASRACNVFVS